MTTPLIFQFSLKPKAVRSQDHFQKQSSCYLNGGLVGGGVGAALEEKRVDPREVRPLELVIKFLHAFADIYKNIKNMKF